MAQHWATQELVNAIRARGELARNTWVTGGFRDWATFYRCEIIAGNIADRYDLD